MKKGKVDRRCLFFRALLFTEANSAFQLLSSLNPSLSQQSKNWLMKVESSPQRYERLKVLDSDSDQLCCKLIYINLNLRYFLGTMYTFLLLFFFFFTVSNMLQHSHLSYKFVLFEISLFKIKERNAKYFAMFREIAFYVKILLIKRTSKSLGVCDD